MDQSFGKKYLGSIIFMIVLIAITAYFIFKDNQLSQLAVFISRVNLWFIALGILAMFCRILFEGGGFYSVFKSFGQKVSFFQNIRYALVGFYFCAITPSSSGGQPSQLYYMQKDGTNLSFASLSVMIVTVLNQLAMLFIAGIMLFMQYEFVVRNLGYMRILLIYSVVANVFIMAGIVFCIFSKKLIRRFIPWIGKVLLRLYFIKDSKGFTQKALNQVDEYIEGARYIKKNPLVLIKVMFWMLLQLSSTYLVTYFVYKAFGLTHNTFWQIFALQSILYLGVSAVPLPGAVGAAESAFVVMFRTLFGPILVIPAMLISRGISFYLFLIISGVSTIIINFNIKRRQIKKNISYINN